MTGIDILILVNLGDEMTPNWQPVAHQRGATLSRTRNTITTTAKDSANALEDFEYGLGTWTISADGVYVQSEQALTHLTDAWKNRTKVSVRWQEEGTDVLEGTALITSADLEGPYDGEATYSVELQGAGTPTPVA